MLLLLVESLIGQILFCRELEPNLGLLLQKYQSKDDEAVMLRARPPYFHDIPGKKLRKNALHNFLSHCLRYFKLTFPPP